MHRVLHPLFALLASVTRQDLARQVAYLKAENKILWARLPDQIMTTPQERRTLLRYGRKLGQQLKELMTIVSYQSFLRWVREAEAHHSAKPSTAKRKPGRPRTPDDIRNLVLRLARENLWGYTRILGELRKLGIKSISRQTVKVILKENNLEPGPRRGEGTWDEFLRIHAQTLWQCDFVTKPMWTRKGLVDLYFLVFLHLGTTT
jgi:putative transposase